MTPQEFEGVLRQTLADRKLSYPERSALARILEEERPDAQRTAALRSQAFALAREAVEDPRARELLAWVEDVVKLLHPVKPGATAVQARPGAASVHSEVLFAPYDDLPARVCRLFGAAEHTADLCVFTITDDRVSDEIRKAHRRGVRVRIISDNDKAGDLGSDVLALAQEGIAVRFDRTAAHMHHKFAVFDDAVLLNGSYNWTRSAASVNNENFVVTGERMLVDSFAKHFEKLWGLLA